MKNTYYINTPLSPSTKALQPFVHSTKNIFPKGALRNFIHLGNSLPVYNPKYNYYFNNSMSNDINSNNSNNSNNNIINNNSASFTTLSYYPSNSPFQFLKSQSVKSLLSRNQQYKTYKEALNTIDKDSDDINIKLNNNHNKIFTKYNNHFNNKYFNSKHDSNLLSSANHTKEFQFYAHDSFGNSISNNDNNGNSNSSYFDNNIIEYIFTTLKLMKYKEQFKHDITLTDFSKYSDNDFMEMKLSVNSIMIIQRFKMALIDYLQTKNEHDVITVDDIRFVIEDNKKIIFGDDERNSCNNSKQYQSCCNSQFDNEVFVPSKKCVSCVNEKKQGLKRKDKSKVRLIKVEKKEEKKSNFVMNKKLRVKAEKLFNKYNLIITEVNNYWNHNNNVVSNNNNYNNEKVNQQCGKQNSTFSMLSSKHTACGSNSNFNTSSKKLI